MFVNFVAVLAQLAAFWSCRLLGSIYFTHGDRIFRVEERRVTNDFDSEMKFDNVQ